MDPESRGEVTRLLAEVGAGRHGADDALLAIVYDELHSLAGRYMRRERASHTLQPTALVHEAYLRLAGREAAGWESRAHFMRVAARAMRRVLIQHARERRADKRGGGRPKEELEDLAVMAEEAPVDILALDEALSRLSKVDARLVQVVELRYFGGLSVEETAKVLGISPVTVKRDWRAARTWLKTEITKER